MFDHHDFAVLDLWPGESDETVYELTVAAGREKREEPVQSIPADLDEMKPGPYLAAVLSSLDLSRLTGSDVITVMRARRRLASHEEAGVYAAMVESAYRVDPETTEKSQFINEYAPEEIGAALTLTRRKADHDLALAFDLQHRLPQVARALEAGEIDVPKARILCRNTSHLEPATAAAVVDETLPRAPNLTTGQINARIRRLCVQADPTEAAERYELSLSERRVTVEENAEGTAALVISQASPEEVMAARDHIDRLAKQLKTEEDPRTIDQVRADVALAILKGELEGIGHSSRGSVVMTVALTTLAGLDDNPGDLGGYGPVVSEIARKVAREQHDAEWSAVITDDETGEPRHVVSVRRRPSARQRRMIRALMPVCAFPGCRMPAASSDLDHTLEYGRGGPTTVHNQVPLCRRHHVARHRGGWRYRRIDRTEIEWISPLGHRYRVRPPP